MTFCMAKNKQRIKYQVFWAKNLQIIWIILAISSFQPIKESNSSQLASANIVIQINDQSGSQGGLKESMATSYLNDQANLKKKQLLKKHNQLLQQIQQVDQEEADLNQQLLQVQQLQQVLQNQKEVTQEIVDQSTVDYQGNQQIEDQTLQYQDDQISNSQLSADQAVLLQEQLTMAPLLGQIQKSEKSEGEKSISVKLKLTDEIKKKMLESVKTDNLNGNSVSLNIPIKDLANSTCTSSHCEGIVDAATKVVTGSTQGDRDKQESQESEINASLNITEVKEQRAKPSKVLDQVPKKRQKLEPKSQKKSSHKSRMATDEDESGEKETSLDLKKSQKKQVDDSVIKKSIKLKPVMPSVSDDQESGEIAINSTNQTLDASNQTSSSLGLTEQNQKQKTKIKEMVKQETDKLEKAKDKKEVITKEEQKSTDSGSVDSVQMTGDKDRMKATVLKLKEYSLEKKVEAIGSDSKQNQVPEKVDNQTQRPVDSVPSKIGAQPVPVSQKKKIKRCYDVDDDSSGVNNTQASPQSQNITPAANISEPKSSAGNNQSDDIPAISSEIVPKMPVAPAKDASKDQKLKYLEDLEESLKRTKEQVKMEKVREEAKAKQKQAPILKGLDRDPDTLGSPPVPPPLDDESGDQSSSPGEIEAVAKKSQKQEKQQAKQKKNQKQVKDKETVDEKVEQPPQKQVSKKLNKEKAPSILKSTNKQPQSQKPKLKKPKEKVVPKSTEPSISPDDIEIKIKKDNDDQATSSENVKPEDIEIKIKRDGSEEAAGSTSENQTIWNNTQPNPNNPQSIQEPPSGNQSDITVVPTQPQPQSNNDTSSSSSIVDQTIKQIEETQKIEEIAAKIEKEKSEAKKAQAKKDSILNLLRPKKQSEEGKKKNGREVQQEQDESKRKQVEDEVGQIQQSNFTKKEGAVEEFEKFEADRDKLVTPKKSIPECVQPKPTKSKLRSSTFSDTVTETSKAPAFAGGNKFSGDEDIDENLYFSTHALTQMSLMHKDLENQLQKKEEQEQINKKQQLEELLNSTKIMEKGDISDQIDFQKRLQMSKEFKELQDEEDRQENEALKAQMELEIAQTQIQKKQLEQKKALLKAHKASILKQSELKKQERKTKLEALHTAQTQQQEKMKQMQQKLLAQQKQDQAQKKQQEEQALQEAEQLASSVQAKLQQEKEDEEQRIAAEVAREEKEEEEKKEKAEREEREKKEKVERLVQKNQARYHGLVKKVGEQALQFSLNLKISHLEEALKARQEIEKDQEMREAGFAVPELKVNTVDAFKKSFSFPQIALNDFAVEQLETLKNEENKFNSNLNDKLALNQFIKTTQYVASQLSGHYGKQWINPNQDGITLPRKINKPKIPSNDASSSSSTISGLSLPQQFTNSFDFIPEFLSKQSEKEMQTQLEQPKDQKAENSDEPPVDQATVQQLTPEEQEELKQSSIMSDEEQAKYQTMVDAQLQEQEQEQYRQQLLQDSESSSPVPPEQDVSTLVQGATQKISHMALTTDDLQVSAGEQASGDAFSQESQGQLEEYNQAKTSAPAQTVVKQNFNKPQQKSSGSLSKTQPRLQPLSKPSPKITKNQRTIPLQQEPKPIQSQSVQLKATQSSTKDEQSITISQVTNSDTNTGNVPEIQTPTPEPEFQSQDIYGQISQEDYVKGDDIDEIVGE